MLTWKELLEQERIFFDGKEWMILQEKGLKAGELPETWNISHAKTILSIHKEYLEAGADIIKAKAISAPMA